MAITSGNEIIDKKTPGQTVKVHVPIVEALDGHMKTILTSHVVPDTPLTTLPATALTALWS